MLSQPSSESSYVRGNVNVHYGHGQGSGDAV